MFLVEAPVKIRKIIWEPIVFQSIYTKIKNGISQMNVYAVIITDTRKSALYLKEYFDIRMNSHFTTQVTTETLLDGHGLTENEAS